MTPLWKVTPLCLSAGHLQWLQRHAAQHDGIIPAKPPIFPSFHAVCERAAELFNMADCLPHSDQHSNGEPLSMYFWISGGTSQYQFSSSVWEEGETNWQGRSNSPRSRGLSELSEWQFSFVSINEVFACLEFAWTNTTSPPFNTHTWRLSYFMFNWPVLISTKAQRVASFLTSNFGRDSKTMFVRDQTSNFVTKMMTSDCNDATVECKKDYFFFLIW